MVTDVREWLDREVDKGGLLGTEITHIFFWVVITQLCITALWTERLRYIYFILF